MLHALRRSWAVSWPLLRPLAAGINRFNAAIGKGASLLVLVMLAVGGWNVVGRYLGAIMGRNLSSNAFIEAQWYLFALVFLLGAAWTLQRDGHVRVDVLQSRWRPRRRALADLAGTLLFLLPFCLLMIAASWGAVQFSWQILEQSSDPGGLPRYPLKAMLPLSFLLLMLQGVANAIHHLDQLLGTDPAQQHQEKRGGRR